MGIVPYGSGFVGADAHISPLRGVIAVSEQIKIITAVPPRYAVVAERPGCAAAHMAYSVGRGFRLYRLRRMGGIRGGYMVLDTGGYCGGGPISALAEDVVSECRIRGFRGIVLDAGQRPASPVQYSVSRMLAGAAQKHGFEFYVPEALSGCGESAIVRVTAAISGGTLARHFSDAMKKYGSSRVSVEIERVCMDFRLPEMTGVGREISPDAAEVLKERHSAEGFYSPELAVKYFTYYEKNTPHFVLYDDGYTIRHKLLAARDAGIGRAFLFYPRVRDIYDEIVM